MAAKETIRDGITFLRLAAGEILPPFFDLRGCRGDCRTGRVTGGDGGTMRAGWGFQDNPKYFVITGWILQAYGGNVYAVYHNAHHAHRIPPADREKSASFLSLQSKRFQWQSWRNVAFPDHQPRFYRIGWERPTKTHYVTVRS